MSEALPTEPVTHSFTKDQLLGRAKEYMTLEFGRPVNLEPEQRDAWHERLGVLVMFVEHLTSNWCSPLGGGSDV